jgi:hypothetical protein
VLVVGVGLLFINLQLWCSAVQPVSCILPVAGELPSEHQLVFDTFELIPANRATTNGSTMSAPIQSPIQQQPQQQQLFQRQKMEP